MASTGSLQQQVFTSLKEVGVVKVSETHIIKPEATVSTPIKLKVINIARLLLLLLRPHFAVALPVFFHREILRLPFWKALPVLVLWLYCVVASVSDPVFGFVRKLKPGLYLHGEKAIRLAHASKLHDLVHSYKPPFWLWNGDLLTVVPSLKKGTPPTYSRAEFAVRGHESDVFATDWRFPTGEWSGKVAILIAGVGGNANARYIVQVGDELLKQGTIICVINPRGLEGSPNIKEVTKLLDTNALGDDIAQLVSTIDNTLGAIKDEMSIFLIGFSLGAVLTGQYFIKQGDKVPKRVAGGICFSGSFKSGYLKRGLRYWNYYQPMVVPSLVESIVGKYKTTLDDILEPGELEKFLSNLSYEEMYETLILPRASGNQTFANILEGMEATEEERMRIRRPVLLLSALDDPMHSAEMIGVEQEHKNPNLIYGLTNGGGHVSWASDHALSFTWMQEVAVRFTDAVVVERSTSSPSNTM